MPAFGETGFSSNGSNTASFGAAYLSPSIWGTSDGSMVMDGLGHFDVQHFNSDPVILAPVVIGAGATTSAFYQTVPTGIKLLRNVSASAAQLVFGDATTANHALTVTTGATAGNGFTLFFSPTQAVIPGNSPSVTPKYLEANISFDSGNSPTSITTAFLGWVGSSAILQGAVNNTGTFLVTSALAKGSNTIINEPATGLVFYIGNNSIDLITNYSGTTLASYSSVTAIALSSTAYPTVATSTLLVAGLNTGAMFLANYNTAVANGSNYNANAVTTAGLTISSAGFHKYGLFYDGGVYLYAFIDGFQAAKVFVNPGLFDTVQPLAPVFNYLNGGASACTVLVDFIAAGDQLYK